MIPQIITYDQICNAVACGVFIGINIIGIYGLITFIKHLYNLKKNQKKNIGIILFLEMRNNMIVFTKKVKDGMLYVKLQSWVGNTKTYETMSKVDNTIDNAENVAKILTIKEYIKNNSDFDFAQEIMSYIPIFEDEENE